ncbi:MAG: hypothetical protein JNM43_07655 [Planctomycetaceae bacterium]|nr:hypothetical protein [Planctomycetaceae bacterium]
MQNQTRSSNRAVLLFGLFALCHATAAYARGSWLFGSAIAVVYAVVSLFTVGLLGLAILNAGETGSQVVSRGVFVFFVSFVLAFPALINPQVQHLIDLQTTDRQIRSELSNILNSDPAFQSVIIATLKRKCVCVELSGSVPSADVYDRLRSQISSQCPTVANVLIDWDVVISDEQKK